MTLPEDDPISPLIHEKAAAIQLAVRMTMTALGGTFEPGQLVFTLPPSSSHILWLTGHIATSLDRMTAGAIGAPRVLPDRYVELFAIGSKPVADAAAYPPLAELLASLTKATDAAVARIHNLADSDLARPLPQELPVARIFPTLGVLLTGAVYHTAYHTGQISMLRRAQGLPTGLGV